MRHSPTLSLYILRGLLQNALLCFLVLEVVQGILFTFRATEGISFDFLIIFPVLLRAFGQALCYTIPISILFAAGLLAGRLNADREILAMKSFGISPFQALIPVVIVGAILSGFSFYWNQQWVPWLRFANRNVDTLILEHLGYLGEGWNLERSHGSRSIWIQHHKGPLLEGIFIGILKDPGKGEDEGPLPREVLEKIDAPSYPFYLYAESGRVYRGEDKDAGRLVMDLKGVSIYFDNDLLEPELKSDFMHRLHFEHLRWVPRFERTKRKGVKDMVRAELIEVIDEHFARWRAAEAKGDAAAGDESRRVYSSALTEIHRRLSLSLAALTFPLTAFVIGLFTRSSNRLLPFFAAGTIVPGIFFGIELAANPVAKSGGEPWAIVEIGNLTLMLLSGLLLARTLRSPKG